MLFGVHDNRQVEVYFGSSREVEMTKEELAGFIIEETEIERSDTGHKWTEGVAELVDSGIESSEQRHRDGPECVKEVVKLKPLSERTREDATR